MPIERRDDGSMFGTQVLSCDVCDKELLFSHSRKELDREADALGFRHEVRGQVFYLCGKKDCHRTLGAA